MNVKHIIDVCQTQVVQHANRSMPFLCTVFRLYLNVTIAIFKDIFLDGLKIFYKLLYFHNYKKK